MKRDTRPNLKQSQGGQVARPRWGNGRHRDPVAAALVPDLGAKPQSVEHRMRELNHDVAAVIDKMLELGSVERAIEYARPILAAIERIKPRPVIELLQPAAEADALEEIPESAYRLAREQGLPLREPRRRWLARAKRDHVFQYQLICSLEHEDRCDVEALA